MTGSAQRELFLKYKDAMYTTLCRMLNNEEEATDALQETFVSVFKVAFVPIDINPPWVHGSRQ